MAFKPEEEKVIEAVIEQAKKLVKKFGYKYIQSNFKNGS